MICAGRLAPLGKIQFDAPSSVCRNVAIAEYAVATARNARAR